MVRLYTASSAAFDASWQFADVWGAVVLVVERAHDAKPRMIQIWNLETKQLEFSQELFVGMSYDASLGYFHTFEIAPETSVAPALPTTSSFDDGGGAVRTSCALGLNFANMTEATAFGARVRGEIDALESKLAALRIDTELGLASASAVADVDSLTSPSPQGCASLSRGFSVFCFSARPH